MIHRTHIKWIALAFVISTQVQALSYQDLDQNVDGFINHDEAQEMPELAGQWTATDTNQDGKVDKAEFALFEIMINRPIEVVDDTR